MTYRIPARVQARRRQQAYRDRQDARRAPDRDAFAAAVLRAALASARVREVQLVFDGAAQALVAAGFDGDEVRRKLRQMLDAARPVRRTGNTA